MPRYTNTDDEFLCHPSTLYQWWQEKGKLLLILLILMERKYYEVSKLERWQFPLIPKAPFQELWNLTSQSESAE